MAEQQLVDYIKKARQSGQADSQTRALLAKNGWTDAEVGDAVASLDRPAIQTQPSAQPQPVQQPKYQPEVKAEPQIRPASPAYPSSATAASVQYQAKPVQSRVEPVERKNSHLVLKLLVVLIVLIVIGGAGYFMMAQTNLLGNLFNFSSPQVPETSTPGANTQPGQGAVPETMATAKILTVPQGFDASKIIVAAFDKAGSKVAFCAPQISDNKVSCFVNGEKLANPYNYRPYWIGFSPNGQRVVFIYLDPVTKQSFVYENGLESTRYAGTVNTPIFSNDSQSFLYTVMGKDTKTFVVASGTAYSPHDKVYGVPALSTDGKYIIYGARDGQDIFWVADEVK